MNGTLRAFVAVELPPDIRDTLSSLVRFLDQQRIAGLRTVAADSVHLTLKFLGNVQESQVPAIENAVIDAAGESRALALRLAEAGVFPERGAPRVLWVGLTGNVEPLVALQSRLEDALAPLGFEPERRPFRPHLTLGRLNDRATRSDRYRAKQALLSARFEQGQTIAVGALSLMQSILRRDGARYRRLASIPLGDSTVTEA